MVNWLSWQFLLLRTQFPGQVVKLCLLPLRFPHCPLFNHHDDLCSHPSSCISLTLLSLLKVAMSVSSSAAPTFDELADAALKEMQRQQREQQQSIEQQISKNPFDTAVLMPGVPATVTTSTTVGGRTVVRKVPTNPSPTSNSNNSNKTLSTAAQPTPSPTTASATPTTTITSATAPTTTITSATSSTSPNPTSAASFDPSAEPPLPVAPAEEVSNLEIAHLNETNVAALLSQQKANAHLTSHLSTALATQLHTIQQQHTKLAYIRSELAKLDASLSENINTLRSEIEGVGREVLYAQTEFDKKEKEYLEARKVLAKVKQRKLLLTGHLDYIILTNEVDKAKKLKELERQMFGGSGSGSEDGSGGTADESGGGGNEVVKVVAAAVPQPTAPPAFGGFGDDDSGSAAASSGGRHTSGNGTVNGSGRR